MNERLDKFKNKLKTNALAFCKWAQRFFKENYLMFGYIAASLIIELTGVAVTSGKFYMTEPWLFFTFIAIVCLISQYLPGHRSRYVLFLAALLGNFALDLIFIIVFDSTGGTVFDYAMLKLRNDAITIVETLPFDFAYVFVSVIVITMYATFGFMLTKRIQKPNVSVSAKITTAALCVIALGSNAMLAYFGNFKNDSNDLNYMLDQTETGTYSNKGIIGNLYNELVRGLWFSDIDVGDISELHDFIYASITEPTEYFGRASDYNVVTVLCESFEWFTFLYDAQRYPNGYARQTLESVTREHDAQKIIADLHTLYPNLYRFYESQSTVILNNSYSLEKTDISENKTIIGNYPLFEYINYAYPENTLPYSLPNIMRNMFEVESNSFHNGYKTFYNRNIHHENALGFKSYTAAEDMNFVGDDTGVGERNLDSIMFDTCKDRMFPTDRRFNTYITTITQHGQYAERDNLQEYYDKLDALEILPYDENDEDANALRYYCAAGMDFDKAIGIMLDYLDANDLADKTLITLFGDHNVYYQGVSNYVKNITGTSAPNYCELYRVPVMIKVGNQSLGNPVINKFTCVADIYPTILDLLGVTTFSNLNYGVSAFNTKSSSILYSRAYNKFLTDKIYFNSLSNILYKSADVDEKYISDIQKTASELLEKISHVNRIFASDFFKGDNEAEFYARLTAAQL